MKNLALILGMTLTTLVLWVIIGLHLRSHNIDNRKTLDTPPEVSGTIDIEFLQKISNN